jgi:hypothetical protein
MNDIKAWYLELSDGNKQIFLALVSNHLTIHGRFVGLEVHGEGQIQAFKGLNELQAFVALKGLACFQPRSAANLSYLVKSNTFHPRWCL